MNFFEHQDRAKRRTRVLVSLFAAAILSIIVIVNLAVLLALALSEGYPEPLLSKAFLGRHSGAIFWTTLLTGGVIAIASLYRTLALRAGGGAVASSLGGTQVPPDTTDPLRRRFRNVVEEMAIAAGVPVPEIYVLEREQGINAFAAGHSTSDAALAVTRGALETLDREELQGVVAHEFGHILNGDMRLNIRMIGLLFGILVLMVVGRRVMFSVRHSRGGRDGAGIAAAGLVLMLVGYIGLLFGRLIQASVSRQREFLADASAVQFTRNPGGIGGALKKIGAAKAGVLVWADTEEVGHMLFARGERTRLMSTHPPLVDRIRAIEPRFDPSEFDTIRQRMAQRHAQSKQAEAEAAAEPAAGRGGGPGRIPLDAGGLIDSLGQPGVQQVLAAALLIADIPPTLERAAHSSEWAPELVCMLLLDPDREIRERQLLMVAESLGHESEAQLRSLLGAAGDVDPALRMPLLEIAFPALRQRPEEELRALVALTERLIHADGNVDVFEYALGKSLSMHIEDALDPSHTRSSGSRKLTDHAREAYDLLFVLARQGHEDGTAAVTALSAGLEPLGIRPGSHRGPQGDWMERLDAALEVLNELRNDDKRRLVEAMVATITHAGEVVPAERELMRVICAALHVPLPAHA